MKLFSKPINFVKEVKVQLLKVSWPTKDELIGATITVIMLTFLIGIFIYIIDSILSAILNLIYQ